MQPLSRRVAGRNPAATQNGRLPQNRDEECRQNRGGDCRRIGRWFLPPLAHASTRRARRNSASPWVRMPPCRSSMAWCRPGRVSSIRIELEPASIWITSSGSASSSTGTRSSSSRTVIRHPLESFFILDAPPAIGVKGIGPSNLRAQRHESPGHDSGRSRRFKPRINTDIHGLISIGANPRKSVMFTSFCQETLISER
jgi:hypothetical protein